MEYPSRSLLRSLALQLRHHTLWYFRDDADLGTYEGFWFLVYGFWFGFQFNQKPETTNHKPETRNDGNLSSIRI